MGNPKGSWILYRLFIRGRKGGLPGTSCNRASPIAEDGAVFEGQQTVPLGVIENQIKSMLQGRRKQLAPMAVDLITVIEGQIVVSTVKANDDTVEQYSIQS